MDLKQKIEEEIINYRRSKRCQINTSSNNGRSIECNTVGGGTLYVPMAMAITTTPNHKNNRKSKLPWHGTCCIHVKSTPRCAKSNIILLCSLYGFCTNTKHITQHKIPERHNQILAFCGRQNLNGTRKYTTRHTLTLVQPSPPIPQFSHLSIPCLSLTLISAINFANCSALIPQCFAQFLRWCFCQSRKKFNIRFDSTRT